MNPSSERARTVEPLRRAAFVLILTPIAVLILYTAGYALFCAVSYDDFPEALAIKVELLPVIFPIHMVTGGLALMLLPLVIALRRRPRWHRPLGRIAAIDVAVAGLTAYPVAWVVPVTTVSAAGFSAQATTWLALLAAGLWNIRRRRFAAHWQCMLLMTATTYGAVFFRVFLALWAMSGSQRWYETFYACDSWIAWMLPLGVTAVLLVRRQRPIFKGWSRPTPSAAKRPRGIRMDRLARLSRRSGPYGRKP